MKDSEVIKQIRNIAKSGRVRWRVHAQQRMSDRAISRQEVINVIEDGEIITTYIDDMPYPSYLMMAIVRERPIHVLVGVDGAGNYCYVITVYEPDSEYFESDHRTRNKGNKS